MIVSRSVLEEYVPEIKKIDSKTLYAHFNQCGIEVEKAYLLRNIKNIEAGKIIKITGHEKLNKLSVLTVKIKNKNFQILTNIKDLREGQILLFALKGAHLANNKIIDNVEIAGVKSEGMIVGYNDLIDSDHVSAPFFSSDYIILDNDKVDLNNFFNDVVYDLSVPSNRPELNTIAGICFELVSIFGFKSSSLMTNVKSSTSQSTFGLFNLKPFKDNLLRKLILALNGVKIGNINQMEVEFVGNLFGVNIICGNEKLPKNLQTKIVTKDGRKEVALYNNEKLIAQNLYHIEPEYKINNDTKLINIALISLDEAAKQLLLKKNGLPSFTKAALKHMPIVFNYYAFNYLTKILKAKLVVNKLAKLEKANVIHFDFNNLNAFIHTDYSKEKLIAALKHYNFKIQGNSITTPLYRNDLANAYDIYEEVLKIVDINKLDPEPISTTIDLKKVDNSEYDITKNIRAFLVNNGYSEVKTYNLTSKESNDNFNEFGYTNPVQIINPLSSNRTYMKFSNLKSLLEVMQLNTSYKNVVTPLFEITKIYHDKNSNVNLSLLVAENAMLDPLNNKNIKLSLLNLKTLCNSLLSLNATKAEFIPEVKIAFANENETLALKTIDGNIIGYVGSIKKPILKQHDLMDKYYFISINLILNNKESKKTVVKHSAYQNFTKDLTLTFEKKSNIKDAIEAINKINDIAYTEIKDIYQNNDIVSYNLKLWFNNHKMYDNESMSQVFQACIDAARKVGATVKEN